MKVEFQYSSGNGQMNHKAKNKVNIISKLLDKVYHFKSLLNTPLLTLILKESPLKSNLKIKSFKEIFNPLLFLNFAIFSRIE